MPDVLSLVREQAEYFYLTKKLRLWGIAYCTPGDDVILSYEIDDLIAFNDGLRALLPKGLH